MTAPNKHSDCTLWMGNIEPYMDENFILHAFSSAGFHVKQVKMARNKYNPNMPADYCFIEFHAEETALAAIKTLSGQHIPNTQPKKYYILNPAGPSRPKDNFQGFSVWVGDLEPSVDDGILFKHFKNKFQTALSAKVVLDMNGASREFGFVRFSEEKDQQRAMQELNNSMLAGKSIRVKTALPKKPTPGGGTSTATRGGFRPQQGRPQYDQQYYAQQQYYGQQQNWYGAYDQSSYYGMQGAVDNSEVLEEPIIYDEPNQINKDFVTTSGEVYKTLDESRWFGPAHPTYMESS